MAAFPSIREHFAAIIQPLQHVNVVEMGAHHGSDTVDLVRRIGRRTYTYTAFEAGPPQLVQLRSTVERNGLKVTICPKAVAAQTGRCSWWPSLGPHYSGSSSIRLPTMHLQWWPECKFGAPGEVDCTTLDDYFGDSIPNPVHFVWADIQGAEGDAIRGGARFFAQTQYFYAEVWNQPGYEGGVVKNEMVPLLEEMTRCRWDVEADYGDVLYRNLSICPR